MKPYRPSPRWSASTKRLATAALLVLFAYGIYLIRGLLIPLLMSLVVAYVLHPIVGLLQKYARLPRTIAIAIIYIVLIAALVAIPARAVPQFVSQINAFILDIPAFLEELLLLLEEPVTIMGQEIVPTDIVPLERGIEFLLNYVPSVGIQSVNIFGSLASATLSTVGWLLVVLFVSFYMVKDHQLLFRGFVSIVPAAYEEEMYQLGYEISEIWNSFLRGQLILFAIMGTLVFTLATIIGLPHALLLGFISGFVEFIPQIGATLAMIPAVLIAFVQYDQSWLGAQMSPLLFAALIMVGYIILQQIENYWLVPRVIGRNLNMHPMIVFVGALAGAGLAGVLGILLAAPILASARVVFRYVYCKLLDQPPFPDIAQAPSEEPEPQQTQLERSSAPSSTTAD